MHIYTYRGPCDEEYEFISDTGASPGQFILCEVCRTHHLFELFEHIEIENEVLRKKV